MATDAHVIKNLLQRKAVGGFEKMAGWGLFMNSISNIKLKTV